MKDKVALVTGASGGLGTHVTRAFLDAGATVVGTSRTIQQSDFASSRFIAMDAEISTLDSAKALVSQIAARFGRLDILVHTVGGFAGGQSLADTDDATFQRMLDLNLNSAFHILRARFPFSGRRETVASLRLAAARQLSRERGSAPIVLPRLRWFH
jgi:NAD(P)-dependent dehydrogenase (short-subunit alcohol dehydrogenase family)